ncbi:MAG: T9SS type A sorting domain-containing protein [Phycisphaerae bacterium]|nr:T9SS type A sorting domain-containing protein [Saprospiraceae bacterium]
MNSLEPFYSATDQSVTIPISSLPVGLYYVTLQSEGRTYSGKFVKM